MGFLNKIIRFFSGRMDQPEIHKIKEQVMSLQEDFAAFKTDITEKLSSLDPVLTEIQADIERLKSASNQTPPEVLAGMTEIQNKVAALADTAKAIAAIDNPAVEPPIEEPL
jgi:capsule polysaccharide export protein KpsE/RkpR